MQAWRNGAAPHGGGAASLRGSGSVQGGLGFAEEALGLDDLGQRFDLGFEFLLSQWTAMCGYGVSMFWCTGFACPGGQSQVNTYV